MTVEGTRTREDGMDEREDGPHGAMRGIEDLMDELADLCKRDGETREQATSRLVAEGHPLMMSMARSRDRVHALAVAKVGTPDGGRARAERELDALAKRRSERTGETHAAAYSAVLNTLEGRRLYAEHSGS